MKIDCVFLTVFSNGSGPRSDQIQTADSYRDIINKSARDARDETYTYNT